MSANVSRCRWNLVAAGLALILPLSGLRVSGWIHDRVSRLPVGGEYHAIDQVGRSIIP